MICYEEPNSPVPRLGCHCSACCHAREQSIPVRLRDLAYRRYDNPQEWTISNTEPIIHRMFQIYIHGDIGLAEMQIELIAALADYADRQDKQISDLVMAAPTLPIILKDAPSSMS